MVINFSVPSLNMIKTFAFHFLNAGFYNHKCNEGSILGSNFCPHFVVLWNPHFKVEKRLCTLYEGFDRDFCGTLRSFVPETCDGAEWRASIFVDV